MTAPTARRTALRSLALLAALPCAPLRAQDQKPLEWVVGYAAGGGSDVVARTVAEQMRATLGRTIVVVNKPGAATNIAAEYVARSRDVGNVMLTADFATLAANPSLFAKLPYDPERDFVPVGLLARFPMLLVVPASHPAKSYREFAAWARAQPDPVPCGSAGPGSPHHLTGELFREQSGLRLQHVPYRGAAPAVQDLMGGQIPCAFMDTATVQQQLVAGTLRALGVASPARLRTMADIPTFAEQGLSGVEAYAWQGLVAPAATPPEQVARLSAALQSALDSTPVKARFQVLALEALPGTPKQMADYVRAERERWGRLIKANDIRLD